MNAYHNKLFLSAKTYACILTPFIIRFEFLASLTGKAVKQARQCRLIQSQSIAGKWRFYQHALPNTRSRMGCSSSEKSPLWALLTDAFHQGLHTCLYDARGLTSGSQSEQFHFPTFSTSLLCSLVNIQGRMMHYRSNGVHIWSFSEKPLVLPVGA